MSTIFGIIIKNDTEILSKEETERYLNEELDGDEENDYTEVEIGKRGYGYLTWRNPLAKYLPDEFEIYALDNTAQGIYNIGDFKREIKELIL